jgi:hypothetical protein
MTTYELQYRFNQEMDKYKLPDPVISSTVEDFINYAYQQYVTEKYDSLIDPEEKFEVTERISRKPIVLMDSIVLLRMIFNISLVNLQMLILLIVMVNLLLHQ